MSANAASPRYGGRVPAMTATLTALIALSVLAGWVLGVAQLKSVLPGTVEMKANAAVGLLLAAASLATTNAPLRAQRAGQGLALAVALLGLATLAEYVFEFDLGIDELVFRDPNPIGAPGRMSPYSALALTCLGLALAALPWRALRAFVYTLASVVVLVGAVSVLGYAWEVSEIVSSPWLPPVAVNTAIAFVLLGTGALMAAARVAEPPTPPRNALMLEQRVLVGFGAAAALVFLSIAFTYRAAADLADSAGVLARSQELRQTARELYTMLSDAESAQRGYLITGRKELRAAYADYATRLPPLAASLHDLARGRGVGEARLAELAARLRLRLDALASQAARYETDPAVAYAEVAADPGAELMHEILDHTETIARAEESWLEAREADANRTRLLTLTSLVLTFVVATGVLAVLFRSIRGEIAGRRRSEDALRDAHRLVDSVVENIPHTVVVKDAATLELVRVNRAAEDLLGRPREALLGRSDPALFPHEAAASIAARDREALATGTIQDIPQERIQTRDRGERVLHTRKIPICAEDGQARYLLSISEDITEQARRESEIRALNTALSERAAEIEAVNKELEAFSYSVSHDLRAPLRHINGYIELFRSATEGALGDEPRRYLAVIQQASRQMDELISDLLGFSRMARAEMHHGEVDLKIVVDSAIAALETETRGRHIDWRIGALPVVQGDAAMLKIVYTNLVGNAVKYSSTRSSASIEIGAEGEENGRPVLYVRDNGVGFDMRYAGKLFGIFQRLHHPDEFEGTGVGLATVQRIVARHGGRIWAEAAVGRGATFYFTLERGAAGGAAP